MRADFLEDNWQTNGCVPLSIDMPRFSEKLGDLETPIHNHHLSRSHRRLLKHRDRMLGLNSAPPQIGPMIFRRIFTFRAATNTKVSIILER